MPMIRSAFATLSALVVGASVFGQVIPDPADEYFRAYMMNNEAERLVQGNDLQRALDKYQQAQTVFDSIAKNNPNWQSGMLNTRRQRVTTAVADVQARLNANPGAGSGGGAAAPIAGAAPTAAAPAPLVGATPIQLGPVNAAPVAPVPSSGDPLQDAFEQMKRAIGSREAALQQQLTDTQAQIGRHAMVADQMLGQRNEAVKQRDEFYTQAAKLQQAVTDQQAKVTDLEKQLASGGAVKAELDKARRELADVQEQSKDTKERLIKAESAVMNQSARLTEAASKLEIAEKQRDEYKTKLMGLEAENDSLKKRGPVPADQKGLVAEIDRLNKALEDTRKQLETVKAEGVRKDTEIAQLKGDLTKIQGELVALRKENAAYESQVNDLTLQLKKIRDAADDPKKAGGEDAPQLMAENQLLRAVILRQLRQQAREQQQKSLVIEKIKKTENASKDLIDQVELLGSARMTLSEDEQKLFTTPQLQEIMGGGDGIKATLVAKSDSKKGEAGKEPAKAENKTQAMIDSLIEKGNQLLNDGKLPEAAAAYEDVLRADPKNATGFAGLAWARVQQDKLDEAEATLKKSLAYDPNNAAAHYMLAVTFFRRDRLNEAMSSFEKSLEINGKNARARHYLGVITSKMGMVERAEREFKSALAIDPGYGEADFNLAVLFATKDPPNWSDAKKHYHDAVKKGVKADPAMEKLLEGAKS